MNRSEQAAAEGVKQSRSRAKGGGAFPIAERGEIGYNIAQVDGFLSRARDTYDRSSSVAAPVTSSEIRATAFKVKRKGYSSRYVDAAMDRLEEVFYERERRTRVQQIGEEAWWAEIGELLSEVRGRLTRERGRRFRRRGLFASGYRRSEVDAFLDRVAAMFAGQEQLTTVEVRNAVFHPQLRGYNEDQVDALLDAVIELLLASR